MTNDERTLILLAAELLRNPENCGARVRLTLADALDRIAGNGEEKRLVFNHGMPDGCDTAVYTKDAILLRDLYFGKRVEKKEGKP